ncbi:MAG: hypothetical protein P9L92_01345 [Candidatus Electryonea clarkiae]|nr:hypothetical protein [Candidatus Electryonea clarkiae]MDP8287469.1 hypothetical protein [Candidatus Electryonea clarkiae]
MKKLFVFVVILAFAITSAFAGDMFVKGGMELGGSFSFQTNSGEAYEDANGDGSTVINFMPSGGYFFMDNLAVVGVINYTSSSQGDWKSGQVGIGPGVEYYLGNMMGPGYVFFHVCYLYTSTSWDNGTTDGSGKNTSLTIAPSYFIPINEKVGLVPALFYTMDNNDGNTDDDVDGLAGNTMGLRIGFKFYK